MVMYKSAKLVSLHYNQMRKAISFVFVILLSTLVQSQTQECHPTCDCSNGEFPCGACAEPLFQKFGPTGDYCVICPGARCESCSKDWVCSQFKSCPLNNQKPNRLGTQCISCNVANCRHCEYPLANRCSACQPGYTFTNDLQCQEIQTCPIQNCDLCFNDNPNYCQICSDNFYLDQGQRSCSDQRCVVEGCQNCQPGNNFQCANCSQGYVKKDNKCEKVISDCQAKNCQTCTVNDNTKCAACKQGFILYGPNSICETCQVLAGSRCEFCSVVNPRLCIRCKTGFKLDPRNLGKCILA